MNVNRGRNQGVKADPWRHARTLVPPCPNEVMRGTLRYIYRGLEMTQFKHMTVAKSWKYYLKVGGVIIQAFFLVLFDKKWDT